MKPNQSPRRSPFRYAAYSVATSTLALIAKSASAAIETGLNETATKSGLKTTNADLTVTVGTLIRSLLGFVGIIFLVLTVYAGFLWMTAQGNEEQVTKAKKILSGAIIGMIIVFASYSISNFVIDAVLQGSGL